MTTFCHCEEQSDEAIYKPESKKLFCKNANILDCFAGKPTRNDKKS
ncbi:hypothetical protein [Helicobacter sp. CLO-3]|nr:hypothetical protein [Helicobacter sp. CLO-3]